MKNVKRLAVYCGSAPGSQPAFAELTRATARAMVKHDVELVYGGGRLGLMGIIADSVLELGGKAYGVIPQLLVHLEVAHTGLTELRHVITMGERKAVMSEMSDGFLCLPGGIGTLEGFFEILTWGQLGIHNKPCGVLNVAGYFDLLTGFLDHAVREGFLTAEHRQMILVESDPGKLLERMGQYAPAEGERLMGRANR